VRISACMMVKNEQELLPQCLASLQRARVDEIIVVDTGSTDATREIAIKFGATVYDHSWNDDFSAMRNISLSYGSGDWLLVIDADEELILTEPMTAFKRWLGSLKDYPCQDEHGNKSVKNLNGVAMDVKDIRGGRQFSAWNQPRLFRRGQVHYEGIIHNQAIVDGKDVLLCDQAYIRHYGYDLNQEKTQAKYDRTVGLIKKRMESEPWAQGHFYLAEKYAEFGKLREALEECNKYIALKPTLDPVFNGTVYQLAANCSINLKEYDAVIGYCTAGLGFYPNYPDLSYFLSLAGAELGDWKLCADGALMHLKALKVYRENPASAGCRFVFKAGKEHELLSAHRLAMCSLRIGANGYQLAQALLDDPTIPDATKGNVREEISRNMEILRHDLGFGAEYVQVSPFLEVVERSESL
jgi:glycosyltransferase involved in cell wall biosynthesis